MGQLRMSRYRLLELVRRPPGNVIPLNHDGAWLPPCTTMQSNNIFGSGNSNW